MRPDQPDLVAWPWPSLLPLCGRKFRGSFRPRGRPLPWISNADMALAPQKRSGSDSPPSDWDTVLTLSIAKHADLTHASGPRIANQPRGSSHLVPITRRLRDFLLDLQPLNKSALDPSASSICSSLRYPHASSCASEVHQAFIPQSRRTLGRTILTLTRQPGSRQALPVTSPRTYTENSAMGHLINVMNCSMIHTWSRAVLESRDTEIEPVRAHVVERADCEAVPNHGALLSHSFSDPDNACAGEGIIRKITAEVADPSAELPSPFGVAICCNVHSICERDAPATRVRNLKQRMTGQLCCGGSLLANLTRGSANSFGWGQATCFPHSRGTHPALQPSEPQH